MDKVSLIKKIIQKKEFSQLLKKDVELAFSKFENRQICDEEKVRLTRDLLRKVFSAFASQKILSLKDKSPEWILRKHLSTRERLLFYPQVYERLLRDFSLEKNLVIFDLGAGVNGFSYCYFKQRVKYFAVEAMGQLVELMNYYFRKNKISGNALHMSLFDLKDLKKMIKKQKGVKVVFLFKTIDSLEMLENDYSKKLLLEIAPNVDRVVVSFATKSFIRRVRFKVKRNWILNFIEDNFEILEDFEIGGERYISFRNVLI